MKPEKRATTTADIHPVISERWSPRGFDPGPVEEAKLHRIFEAARWAPSSRNEQPWRFLVARKGEEHYEKLFQGLDEYNRKWAWTAPVAGFTLAQKRFIRNNSDNRHYMHDTGLAMGNFLAQATAEGLYVHLLAGIEPERIIADFAIDPEEYEVVAGFVLGYRSEAMLEQLDEKYRKSEQQPRERKALRELVFGKKFGEPVTWLPR